MVSSRTWKKTRLQNARRWCNFSLIGILRDDGRTNILMFGVYHLKQKVLLWRCLLGKHQIEDFTTGKRVNYSFSLCDMLQRISNNYSLVMDFVRQLELLSRNSRVIIISRFKTYSLENIVDCMIPFKYMDMLFPLNGSLDSSKSCGIRSPLLNGICFFKSVGVSLFMIASKQRKSLHKYFSFILSASDYLHYVNYLFFVDVQLKLMLYINSIYVAKMSKPQHELYMIAPC